MAAEVAIEHPSMANHRQVKRTQARPKHSLFGTTLENVDQSELRNIDPSSAHNIGIKKKPERYPVPADMQNLLSARALIQKQQGDISSQNRKVADADNELKQKQLKALGFTPDPQGKPVTKTREGEWLSPKDLEHSSDINSVGLGKSKSYNRDRYGQKPPTHSYALIGDVLGKGNEFGHPQKYDPDDSVVAQNRSQNNNSDMIRLGFNPPVDPDIEAPLKKGSLSLPPNIRHKFGSKECDKLMEDHTAVRACLEKERRSKPFVRPKFDVDTKGYTEKAQSGNYFDVGHVMRYNIWPGHTPLDLGSTFNSIHNDVVYLRREPMSDEHRMIKDAYAKWRDQAMLRDRMNKKWEAYFQSRPKLAANWDRGGGGARAQPAQPPPPSKPKPKPKRKEKTKAEPEKQPDGFEDFKFETPPETPPPKPPSPAKMPETVERDDEFWNFYNKGK